MSLTIPVFCDVTLCHWVNVSWHFFFLPQNTRNHSPNNTVTHPRRFLSSAKLLCRTTVTIMTPEICLQKKSEGVSEKIFHVCLPLSCKCMFFSFTGYNLGFIYPSITSLSVMYFTRIPFNYTPTNYSYLNALTFYWKLLQDDVLFTYFFFFFAKYKELVFYLFIYLLFI